MSLGGAGAAGISTFVILFVVFIITNTVSFVLKIFGVELATSFVAGLLVWAFVLFVVFSGLFYCFFNTEEKKGDRILGILASIFLCCVVIGIGYSSLTNATLTQVYAVYCTIGMTVFLFRMFMWR
ncbi:MAG: hypothetical protein KAS78_02620 [Candidatus Pacebacteria bacterium]|nr:hypothetical protein [Candidatus Paceibacterota bacterium]